MIWVVLAIVLAAVLAIMLGLLVYVTTRLGKMERMLMRARSMAQIARGHTTDAVSAASRAVRHMATREPTTGVITSTEEDYRYCEPQVVYDLENPSQEMDLDGEEADDDHHHHHHHNDGDNDDGGYGDDVYENNPRRQQQGVPPSGLCSSGQVGITPAVLTSVEPRPRPSSASSKPRVVRAMRERPSRRPYDRQPAVAVRSKHPSRDRRRQRLSHVNRTNNKSNNNGSRRQVVFNHNNNNNNNNTAKPSTTAEATRQSHRPLSFGMIQRGGRGRYRLSSDGAGNPRLSSDSAADTGTRASPSPVGAAKTRSL